MCVSSSFSGYVLNPGFHSSVDLYSSWDPPVLPLRRALCPIPLFLDAPAQRLTPLLTREPTPIAK